MSIAHPIVAVTGSSGAGSSSVIKAFEHIFWRERIKAAYIQGSAFHRYNRKEMHEERLKAQKENRMLSHFGPEGNHLDKLETLFFQYASMGTGVARHYLHSTEHAFQLEQELGTFTPWKELDDDTDLLLYRGLHGAMKSGDIDISRYPDLLIGIVPNVNLEWIRKIHRDTKLRGYSLEDVKQSILHRMHDYVHHITPQFARTHINFQMIAVVDTSDPFASEDMPIEDECFVAIHFQKQKKPDFKQLLELLPKSFMSNPTTLVVPGAQITHAIEVIMMPLIHELISKSRAIRGVDHVSKSRGAGVLGMLGQSF